MLKIIAFLALYIAATVAIIAFMDIPTAASVILAAQAAFLVFLGVKAARAELG